MKKVLLFILFFILVSGCSSNSAYKKATGEKPIKMHIEEMRAINNSRLQKISLGMKKQEVKEIMGTKTFYQRNPYTLVPNPYRIESIRTEAGKNYEIIFYYTDLKKQDGALTDDEMTPLVFENGILIGWGWLFVEDKTKKLRIEVR